MSRDSSDSFSVNGNEDFLRDEPAFSCSSPTLSFAESLATMSTTFSESLRDGAKRQNIVVECCQPLPGSDFGVPFWSSAQFGSSTLTRQYSAIRRQTAESVVCILGTVVKLSDLDYEGEHPCPKLCDGNLNASSSVYSSLEFYISRAV